jgi:hypothetical protein
VSVLGPSMQVGPWKEGCRHESECHCRAHWLSLACRPRSWPARAWNASQGDLDRLPLDQSLHRCRILPGGDSPQRRSSALYAWFTPGTVANGHNRGSHYGSLPGAALTEAILVYSNRQPAAGIWYHDHAMGITRLNVYAGMAGLYFIRDSADTGVAGTGPLLARSEVIRSCGYGNPHRAREGDIIRLC